MPTPTTTLTVQLPTTPTRAFRALTRVSQLRRWFGDVLDYDRSLLVFGAGRQLTFISDGTVGQGQVTVYRPPSVLEYSWNTETLRFDLDAEGEETSLTFTSTVRGADAAHHDWEDALDRLRQFLTDPLTTTDTGGVE
ncbi:SRPBCC family protein [Corynebacterium sp.]|uniref:SRPBCC family protein n=1 Tax=Corynebacterium sp. TaxID=1720 RepID=UPI003B3BD4E8